MIDDYDFHPPDDTRLFWMPAEGVRRLDDLPPFAFQLRHRDADAAP